MIEASIRELQGRCKMPVPRVYIEPREEDEAEEKLALNFAATWKRLPLGVRRKLRKYWDSCTIALMSPWITVEESNLQDGECAVCTAMGHRLVFRPSAVADLPDLVLQHLIAHELAHSHQWATGWLVVQADGNLPAEEIESDADERIAEWGFDPDSVRSHYKQKKSQI